MLSHSLILNNQFWYLAEIMLYRLCKGSFRENIGMYIPTTRRWFYLSLGKWGLAGRMSYRYESDIMQTGRNNVVM